VLANDRTFVHCAGSDWLVSASVTPAALGVHVCYSQKVTDLLQLGVELEGALNTQECTTTVGYQYEMPHSGVTVRGTAVCLQVAHCRTYNFTVFVSVIKLFAVFFMCICRTSGLELVCGCCVRKEVAAAAIHAGAEFVSESRQVCLSVRYRLHSRLI
jgi:hypothetical protein